VHPWLSESVQIMVLKFDTTPNVEVGFQTTAETASIASEDPEDEDVKTVASARDGGGKV